MKKYRSHKVVEAAPIVMHTDDLVIVRNADGTEEHVAVPDDFGARGGPSNGDYLVRYQPDGYLSWSPKKAFEDGYTPEPETWQERALKEATDLDVKLQALRKYLLSGPMIEAQALALLQQQYKAMEQYHAVLEARLRHTGVIGTEVAPTVRGGIDTFN